MQIMVEAALEHSAHRVEIVLQSIAGRGLDDHPAPVGLQCLAHVRAAPTGSPMSCRQSKKVTRSRSLPEKSLAMATSNFVLALPI
jgi:hypothetical protein